MKLPEVQERLFALTNKLMLLRQEIDQVAGELHMLARQISRRPSALRAPRSSVPMTPQLKQAIRTYKQHHLDATHETIAQIFQVNSGRVSEALRGKRT